MGLFPAEVHPIFNGGTRITWGYELELLSRGVIPKITRLADQTGLQDSLENWDDLQESIPFLTWWRGDFCYHQLTSVLSLLSAGRSTGDIQNSNLPAMRDSDVPLSTTGTKDVFSIGGQRRPSS